MKYRLYKLASIVLSRIQNAAWNGKHMRTFKWAGRWEARISYRRYLLLTGIMRKYDTEWRQIK